MNKYLPYGCLWGRRLPEDRTPRTLLSRGTYISMRPRRSDCNTGVGTMGYSAVGALGAAREGAERVRGASQEHPRERPSVWR